jgi:hypothetical protein
MDARKRAYGYSAYALILRSLPLTPASEKDRPERWPIAASSQSKQANAVAQRFRGPKFPDAADDANIGS